MPAFEKLEAKEGVEVKDLKDRFQDYIEFKTPKWWEEEPKPEVNEYYPWFDDN